MAAFVRTSFENNYRTLDRHATQRLGEAFAPGAKTENLQSLMQLLGQPDFIIKGTTDSNTAVLNAGAAQSFLMNLTTEGLVEFPNGFERDIEIECWTEDEAGTNYQKIKQTVRGGAVDPTIVNGVTNLSPKVGGRVTFATAAATAADAYNGFSITGAAAATGRYTAAIPKARRVLITSNTMQIVGTGTLSGAGKVDLNSITLATGVIQLGIRGGDDGAEVAPADTEQMVVEFDVLPVESPELAIVTTTTPDQVLVGALGQANENVNWEAHIRVGHLRRTTVATASE
jgi:hypothetical protein